MSSCGGRSSSSLGSPTPLGPSAPPSSFPLRSLLKTHSLPLAVSLPNASPTNPLSASKRPVLLYRSYRTTKVWAQSLRTSSDGSTTCTGPPIVIPESYKGFFSVVGRSGGKATSFTRIEQLCAEKTSFFITKHELPAYSLQGGSECLPGRRTQVEGGSVLQLVKGARPPLGYLKCKDAKNQPVLVKKTAGGKFYLPAPHKSRNCQFVFSAPQLVQLFTLPLSVRLVSGPVPKAPCNFTGMLRLQKVKKETVVLACTMTPREDASLVEIDATSSLLVLPVDDPMFGKQPIYLKTVSYCEENAKEWMSEIKVTHAVEERRSRSLTRSLSDKYMNVLGRCSLDPMFSSQGDIFAPQHSISFTTSENHLGKLASKVKRFKGSRKRQTPKESFENTTKDRRHKTAKEELTMFDNNADASSKSLSNGYKLFTKHRKVSKQNSYVKEPDFRIRSKKTKLADYLSKNKSMSNRPLPVPDRDEVSLFPMGDIDSVNQDYNTSVKSPSSAGGCLYDFDSEEEKLDENLYAEIGDFYQGDQKNSLRNKIEAEICKNNNSRNSFDPSQWRKSEVSSDFELNKEKLKMMSSHAFVDSDCEDSHGDDHQSDSEDECYKSTKEENMFNDSLSMDEDETEQFSEAAVEVYRSDSIIDNNCNVVEWDIPSKEWNSSYISYSNAYEPEKQDELVSEIEDRNINSRLDSASTVTPYMGCKTHSTLIKISNNSESVSHSISSIKIGSENFDSYDNSNPNVDMKNGYNRHESITYNGESIVSIIVQGNSTNQYALNHSFENRNDSADCFSTSPSNELVIKCGDTSLSDNWKEIYPSSSDSGNASDEVNDSEHSFDTDSLVDEFESNTIEDLSNMNKDLRSDLSLKSDQFKMQINDSCLGDSGIINVAETEQEFDCHGFCTDMVPKVDLTDVDRCRDRLCAITDEQLSCKGQLDKSVNKRQMRPKSFTSLETKEKSEAHHLVEVDSLIFKSDHSITLKDDLHPQEKTVNNITHTGTFFVRDIDFMINNDNNLDLPLHNENEDRSIEPETLFIDSCDENIKEDISEIDDVLIPDNISLDSLKPFYNSPVKGGKTSRTNTEITDLCKNLYPIVEEQISEEVTQNLETANDSEISSNQKFSNSGKNLGICLINIR